MAFAEIRFGIERVADPARRAELNDWLTHKVRPMFEQRALPMSEDVMFKWRLLVEDGRKGGHTYSQPDLIIAATALHYGLTVVCATRATSARLVSRFSIPGVMLTPDKKRFWKVEKGEVSHNLLHRVLIGFR